VQLWLGSNRYAPSWQQTVATEDGVAHFARVPVGTLGASVDLLESVDRQETQFAVTPEGGETSIKLNGIGDLPVKVTFTDGTEVGGAWVLAPERQQPALARSFAPAVGFVNDVHRRVCRRSARLGAGPAWQLCPHQHAADHQSHARLQSRRDYRSPIYGSVRAVCDWRARRLQLARLSRSQGRIALRRCKPKG